MENAGGIENGILEILISGRADDAESAEQIYLDEHVEEVARLALSPISDDEFRRHPLIVLLMMHGSRGWEDLLL